MALQGQPYFVGVTGQPAGIISTGLISIGRNSEQVVEGYSCWFSCSGTLYSHERRGMFTDNVCKAAPGARPWFGNTFTYLGHDLFTGDGDKVQNLEIGATTLFNSVHSGIIM